MMGLKSNKEIIKYVVPSLMTYCILGKIPYKEALDLQQRTHKLMIDDDNVSLEELVKKPSAIIYLLEHPHVYTVGRSNRGSYEENDTSVKLEEKRLLLKIPGVEFHYTQRGGKITYHGPGQLVVYPILNLKRHKLSLREYIEKLEKTVQRYCEEKHGLKTRLGSLNGNNAAGVWMEELDLTKKPFRKISAIGIQAARFVTKHGFSLNVNPDMKYFNEIIPCGLKECIATSIEQENHNIKKDSILNLSIVSKDIIKVFSKEWSNTILPLKETFPKVYKELFPLPKL